MSPEQVERLKREYTDQFVQITGDRPDHRRFGSAIGQVKTINMNGRALVEFSEFHKDIGWYDIDLDFLKVVEKPAVAKPEKAAAKPTKPAAKTAGGAKLSPLEMARQMGPRKEPLPRQPRRAGAREKSFHHWKWPGRWVAANRGERSQPQRRPSRQRNHLVQSSRRSTYSASKEPSEATKRPLP